MMHDMHVRVSRQVIGRREEVTHHSVALTIASARTAAASAIREIPTLLTRPGEIERIECEVTYYTVRGQRLVRRYQTERSYVLSTPKPVAVRE